MLTPFPQRTAVVDVGQILHYIWSQWFTSLRNAVNATPGNSTPTTFAKLPDPVSGMLFVVTDSTVNTWGAIVAGGGAFTVGAFFNGVNWTVAAK